MFTDGFEELQSSSDRLTLVIRRNGVRLITYFRPLPATNGPASMEGTWINRYNVACETDDLEEAEVISDEMTDAVNNTGRELLDQLAPVLQHAAKNGCDLHSVLFPQEYEFDFRTVDGTPTLTPHEARPAYSTPSGPVEPASFAIPEDCSLPRYSTRDTIVLESLGVSSFIARVRVDGQELCAKTVDATKAADSAQREVDALWGLTGFIYVPGGKRLVEFLEEYVPRGRPSTLGDIETPAAVGEARRKKWAAQVRETVDALHGVGVIWGDGKPGNVLIHGDSDDAWVVDFGGGWTEGWLTREQSDTVTGDDVAIKKIFEYLGLTAA